MAQLALGLCLGAYGALVVFTLKECSPLAPLRAAIWAHYADRIAIFSLLFLVNAFAAFYSLLRRVALKNTGDKLAHLEKQLQGNSTVSKELSERMFGEE